MITLTPREHARVRQMLYLWLMTVGVLAFNLWLLPTWSWVGGGICGFFFCMIGYSLQAVKYDRLEVTARQASESLTAAEERAQDIITKIATLQRNFARSEVLANAMMQQIGTVVKERDDLRVRLESTRAQLENLNRTQRTKALTELLENWNPSTERKPS